MVALEGIASGCAIVASARGGLVEAAGPCGIYFSNGDSSSLADALERMLTEPGLQGSLVAAGPGHLARMTPEHIAGQYLSLFESLVPGASRPNRIKQGLRAEDHDTQTGAI